MQTKRFVQLRMGISKVKMQGAQTWLQLKWHVPIELSRLPRNPAFEPWPADQLPAVDDLAFLQYTSGSTGNPKGQKTTINGGKMIENDQEEICHRTKAKQLSRHEAQKSKNRPKE